MRYEMTVAGYYLHDVATHDCANEGLHVGGDGPAAGERATQATAHHQGHLRASYSCALVELEWNWRSTLERLQWGSTVAVVQER